LWTSLSEQRRTIADILDKADAIRRKRKEAIALTEDLLRSAFLEMFGDPSDEPEGVAGEGAGGARTSNYGAYATVRSSGDVQWSCSVCDAGRPRIS
jgi:hypothetical protein